ncbi:MAG TPA: CDP-alcohol phosphatidyltransferase family protein, partial [Cyclobacteriaceae bacterium]|nr:CDP-alcohol phosphatidyltransferase family protein [Cyclobacteriaceae bacterium]
MALSKHIPNALTCCNLLCGCLGIMASFQYPPIAPAYFVWAACVFDFLDGFAARALKAYSPMGKELDSLADMVSFGVLPSMV